MLAAARARVSTWGIVFDVDGVLIRGSTVIRGVSDMMSQLYEAQTPFGFLTNSGGHSETEKAKLFSRLFQVPIDTGQVVLSHSPLRDLTNKDRPHLLVGKRYPELESIVRDYGFNSVVTCEDLHSAYPDLYPDMAPTQPGIHLSPLVLQYTAASDPLPKFSRILCLTDPIYWGRELQVCLDILSQSPAPELHNCCSDFEYVSNYPAPRLGNGSFRIALETLYQHKFGVPLPQKLYGKPSPANYHYIQQKLQGLYQTDLDTIYMVGDNPATDIVGATQLGGAWKAILVKTGIYQDSSSYFPQSQEWELSLSKNCAIVPDVCQAYQYVLSKET